MSLPDVTGSSSTSPRNELAEYWKLSMRALIQERKASPLDVDFDTGETILHDVVAPQWGRPASGLDEFFTRTMQELGSPVDTRDHSGRLVGDLKFDTVK
jgi:hypothetical protein